MLDLCDHALIETCKKRLAIMEVEVDRSSEEVTLDDVERVSI